jgi:ribosomal protein S18 acetylase RimI-like enzyme
VTSAERRQVILEPMSDADFSAFVSTTIPAYAADKVTSGQWQEQQSLELARKALEDLLPQGRLTAGHHLFRITDSAGRSVGTLWLAETEQAGKRIAYLYDLWVRPECRRKGYAVDALKAAEVEARRLELGGIGLHAFGHNAGARLLYERLGYETTSLNMFKTL